MTRTYRTTPEMRDRMRARMAELQKLRWCAECSVVAPAGPMGKHQKDAGHRGWTAVPR